MRCSKIKPCNNCERADEVCTFDEPTPTKKQSLNLANRVAQLEGLIERLLDDRESGSLNTINSSETTEAPIFIADRVAQRLTAALGRSRPFDTDATYRGRLVTDDGSSRHVLNSFWASMYDEVCTGPSKRIMNLPLTSNIQIGDLKYLLRHEQPTPEASLWMHRPPEVESQLLYSLLNPTSAEYLLEAFVSHVDQFVRILHKPTLLNRVNHYRRGILADSSDLECQLSAVCSLAVLSLTEDDCVVNLGESREVLLMRFRRDVEIGLGRLNITTTHRVSSLQTLLLHIVS